MTERTKALVYILCTLEQMTFIVGSVWLVGWNGWSYWTFLWAAILVHASTPRLVIDNLEKSA